MNKRKSTVDRNRKFKRKSKVKQFKKNMNEYKLVNVRERTKIDQVRENKLTWANR